MKKFRVQIRAYGYYASFNLESEDNSKAFNDTLVDKLGENAIVWEKDGFSNPSKIWITYEEIVNDNRPLQTKNVLGVELAFRA
tara:strand:+ start:59 stop:307 length:249 start_codon:yes stop_codon:yes gene_type:complete